MPAGNNHVERLLDIAGIAAMAALATAFAILGDTVLGLPPLVPLAAAVIVSVALLGRWGATVAIVLATLCTDFVFLPPRYHWTLNGTALVLAGYYLAAALGAIVVNGRRRGCSD